MQIADEAAIATSIEKTTARNFALDLNAKIMLVDDHPVNLLYMRQILTRAGFENFDEAASGCEAIALYKNSAYNLILMDCQMPGMDGYEASKQIRALENRYLTPPVIIAVTADAMKGARQKCLEAGMDDYISKPIEKMALLQILHKWIPGANMTNFYKPQSSKINPVLSDSAAPIDTARLHDFTGGNKDVEAQLIAMFLESLDEDTAKMENALRATDYRLWDEAAHKIYGAASNIGAHALAALCDEAQYLTDGETEAMQNLHNLIMDQCRQIKALLIQKEAA
jgi:CheY-like chemotaxis protein/HPt (histidine-containing phosphotransfer) domain-containing protein